jgi:hypothetical protein
MGAPEARKRPRLVTSRLLGRSQPHPSFSGTVQDGRPQPPYVPLSAGLRNVTSLRAPHSWRQLLIRESELTSMAVVEAQVRSEFAKNYPSLAPGRWYRVSQSARELDSDDAHALHLESDGGLVEVSVEHIVRRKVGDQEQ